MKSQTFVRTAGLLIAVLWLLLGASSCTKGVPTRTPECNAIINRCMDQCANRPESMSPRNMAVDDGERVMSRPSSCEQACSNKC